MSQPLASSYLRAPLPLALNVAAGYLVIAGLSSLLFFAAAPFLLSLPAQDLFEAQPWAHQAAGYLKAITLNVAYIAAGLGLYRRQSWASRAAYLALFFGTLEAAGSIAWNWAGERPSQEVYRWSLLISAIWNGFFVLLIMRGMRAAQRGAD
jgi:hypothetical protein